MNHMKIFILSIKIFLLNFSSLHASVSIEETVLICSPQKILSQQDSISPSINEKECKMSHRNAINPQNKELWVIADLNIPKNYLIPDKPYGLFISAKASSHIYFNQTSVGRNGTPGNSEKSEIPGKMDAVIYIPRYLLKERNKLAIHMSSHHGLMTLSQPVHQITLAEYKDPTNYILSYYWSSLLFFGMLMMGAIYLTVIIILNKQRKWSNYLMPMMLLLAAAQLMIETYRGIYPYSYPFHDIRLILILISSLLFGLLLLLHTLYTLNVHYKNTIFINVALMILIAIYFTPGFDARSAISILIPIVVSWFISFYHYFKGNRKALIFILVLGIFLLLIIIAPWQFLDKYFFYSIGLVLVSLSVQQAMILTEKEKRRHHEKRRADKLQLILRQINKSDCNEKITINSVGQLQSITITDIKYIKGAGDYVELILINNDVILHSSSLNKMEKKLPATFIRVHRSYIANSEKIQSLKRHKNGSGTLIMQNGSNIPVSRRIMPKVRKKLFD